MNYEWLTPANVLWRVTFLIAGSKNLRAWTLVTATHSRLFFREQDSLRPRLLTAMQYPTRPWALFIQKKFGIITGRLVEKNASYTLVFEVACSVSPSMLSAFRCVSKGRTFWTFSRQKNHTVLEASSALAFLTTANSFWRHPFLFTFAYIKYIIVIKSSQLLSQIKFTPKYIFLYSWLILQSCTVWHQILVPLTNENTNPF